MIGEWLNALAEQAWLAWWIESWLKATLALAVVGFVLCTAMRRSSAARGHPAPHSTVHVSHQNERYPEERSATFAGRTDVEGRLTWALAPPGPMTIDVNMNQPGQRTVMVRHDGSPVRLVLE